MKIEIKQCIAKWSNLTNEITENWIRDYFEIGENEEVELYWVANSVGTVFEFADYYFDFEVVLKCYELNISKETLFNWYFWCLQNESVNISLAKFILSPEERKKQEEKHLAELKERVESAEEIFKQALENYNIKN